jgi:hypothetical protein
MADCGVGEVQCGSCQGVAERLRRCAKVRHALGGIRCAFPPLGVVLAHERTDAALKLIGTPRREFS